MSPTDVPAGRLRFKDLCLDAVRPEVAAAFWSPALGLTAEPRGDGFVLLDEVDTHTLWLNAVPEPVTVKQRVHLDVHVADVADLVALGATVLAEEERWTVLADPEGGELCAFLRPTGELPGYRVAEVVVDAADPERITAWWSELLGVPVQRHPDGAYCWLQDPAVLPWPLVFQAVPEPKRVKNRVHWDLWGSTADARAAGARLLRAADAEGPWDLLADPEGNEFCVFAPEVQSAAANG